MKEFLPSFTEFYRVFFVSGQTNDRILEVDGEDLRTASHERAVEVIRKAGHSVTFLVQSLVDSVREPSLRRLSFVCLFYFYRSSTEFDLFSFRRPSRRRWVRAARPTT